MYSRLHRPINTADDILKVSKFGPRAPALVFFNICRLATESLSTKRSNVKHGHSSRAEILVGNTSCGTYSTFSNKLRFSSAIPVLYSCMEQWTGCQKVYNPEIALVCP